MPLPTRLQAGKLRHRIQIVAPTGGQDTFGGVPDTNWQTVKTTWAEIDGVSAKDALAAGQFVAISSHRLTVRFDPAINSRQRIWFKNRTFQVQGIVNPDERNKMLFIYALEINDSREAITPANNT